MTARMAFPLYWLCAAWLALAAATAARADTGSPVATAALAQHALVLDAGLVPDIEVSSKLQQLVDPSGRLGLQDVLSAPMQAQWRAPAGFLRSAGYTDAAYWFRLPVRNGLERFSPWLFNIAQPELRDIDFYLLSGGEVVANWKAGIAQPFSSRPFHHRNFVFPVSLLPGQSVDIVFRVKTDGPMLVPAYLTEQVEFAEDEQLNLIVLGLLFGSMLVLTLYHAYMYLSAGGFRHLLLGIYISSLLLFVLSAKGIGYQFLWPDSPAFNLQAIKLFAWLSIIWGVGYLLEFLEIRKKYPRLLWLLALFLLVFSIMYIGSMFWYLPRLDMPLRVFHVVVFAIYLAMAARLWWRGTIAERYLGLSLFAMFAASMIYLLYITGQIDHSALAVGSLDYGLALSAAFLTLSLAEQIRQERIHQEMAFHRMLSQESEIRAIREEALHQQEKENQRLKSQVRTRDAELSMVMEHLRESHTRLEDLGHIDGLTGLANLRRFRELLKAHCTGQVQGGKPLSMILIDIDDFRGFNTRHGHVMGDEVLRTIAIFMRSVATRPDDVLSRIAGEELSILLPDTDLEGALVVAERLRRMVADHQWLVQEADGPVTVSISAGVASLVPDDESMAEMLFNQARLALQRAKHQGKNQVAHFEFRRAGPAES